MSFHYSHLFHPCLRLFDPETAHNLSIWALERGFYPRQKIQDDALLQQNLWGLQFSNPVGMAAGFDKDGRVPEALIKMGFGFAEVGTATPKPQNGNEKPRLFRLAREHAVINRMGFNNDGQQVLLRRLQQKNVPGVLGVNIGANKLSAAPIEDYVEGLKTLHSVADYFTINISSPNTPGLRNLQSPDKLNSLLSLVMATRGAIMEAGQPWRPILVKLAPDIHKDDLPSIIECLKFNAVDGIIISNTTVSRDGIAETAVAGQAGGLSGRPLFHASTCMLARVYQMTEGKIPLIGVGGIDTAPRALEKILAGASLIQLYTGLVYEGSSLIYRIKRHIVRYMKENDCQQLSDMVGIKSNIWAKHQ